ncbi:MAG: 30S ribosomal protein S12 methylthiotransferase RimO, partial [Lachnospiraceae bacterium]|nr:30S ribosomal protein S12 methylthiotransferase RimO [Lachnospiraceae bacterium]
MKIFFVSLGCDKNLVDTEMMLGELVDAGHAIVDDENLADIAVINTCSFIHDAKEESINTIIELGELKEKGQLKAVIVCGCLAQRYADQIRTELPEVDVIVGTMAIDEIVAAVAKVEACEKAEFLKSVDGPLVYGKRRVVTTGGHYAYLKIAEGCDKHCTYCAIPKMRGTYRSVPMDVLVKEARELASQGVKELILVAQETTLYGTDLYHEKSLPKLLRALSGIEELYYIRILYCYPEEITDELIDEISYNKKVIKYLDIPIQSGADRVLKRMGRRTTRVELETLVGKLRAKVPDICLRTTLISGFPGERGRDFKETYEFVKRMRFDRLGVFTYSREEDTAAARMSGHLPEFIKNRRKNKIMKLQQTIAFD